MSRGNMTLHQKTAKFCLQIQGKESTKTCEFCEKPMSTRTVHECVSEKLAKHTRQLQDEKKSEAQQIRQEYEAKLRAIETENVHLRCTIEKLTDKLAGKDEIISALTEVVKRPSTNNTNSNNKTNNIVNIFTPLDLSEKTVNEILDKHLTTDVIGDGQKGLANMIHSQLLTDQSGKRKYKCTDKNRHHFQYMNMDGQMERDTKAMKLTNAMAKAKVGVRAITAVQTAFENDESRMNAYMPKALELTDISNNNAKFRQQLACLGTASGDVDVEDEIDDEDVDEDQEED